MGGFLEKLTGYRTAIVSGVTTIVGALVSFGVVAPELGGVVSAQANEFYGAVLALVGIVNLVLRAMTKTPIGKSE